MEKINILVCAHKHDDKTRNNAIYKAVQAGKALRPTLDLGYLCDNVGENISERNSCWSELTVLYWGWKNVKDVEYMGLNHYRRYFDLNITAANIDNLMKDCDMIVVKSDSMYSNHERAKNLMHMTSIEDFYVFADTFLTIYPEHKEAFMEYFYHSKKSYPFQMFVSKKEVYDDYCSFMFPVLFETEKRVKPHGYTRQKRTMGYFGEWFLGLYIYCKNIKVKAVPILDLSCTPRKRSLGNRLNNSMRRLFYGMNNIMYRRPATLQVPDGIRGGLKADGIELNEI